MQIYLARNNQQAGPYTVEQLNQMLTNQQVLLTDLVWHQGMSEWKTLGELTGGQLVYQPQGYTIPSPLPTQQPKPSAQQIASPVRGELATIPSRILAKIIDLLLWLPVPVLLTAFFSDSESAKFAALNQEFMQVTLGNNPDPNLVQSLQSELFTIIPQEAWIATAVYILAMLVFQAILLTKTGQSIGKRLTKIKVVDAETEQNVSMLRAFTLRSFVFIILNFLFMPFITFIDAVFALGEKRQTLHDKVAKTKVIRQ